jgi:hypothetical protein
VWQDWSYIEELPCKGENQMASSNG